jgi:uncharacterized protein (TIGR02466 family)
MNDSFAGHLELFPSVVAKYTHSDPESIRKIFLNIIDRYPKDQIHYEEERFQHYYNRGDLSEKQHPELTEFMSWTRSCVSDYAEKFFGLGDRKFVDLNVWLNSNRGGSQVAHTHNNSLFSATYYVQLDPSKHVGLNFYNPKFSVNANKAVIDIEPDMDNNHYSMPFYPAQVTQGELLIWPSQLLHGYDQPEVDQARISVSMNFLPETIGGSLYGFKISKL